MNFTIEGLPKGKGRPRFTRSGHTYTPDTTRKYEALVTARAKEAMIGKRKIEKPNAVRVDILAIFPVPSSWSKKRRTAALQVSSITSQSRTLTTCRRRFLTA